MLNATTAVEKVILREIALKETTAEEVVIVVATEADGAAAHLAEAGPPTEEVAETEVTVVRTDVRRSNVKVCVSSASKRVILRETAPMLATIAVDLAMREGTMIARHDATEISQDRPVRDEADVTPLPEDETHLLEIEGPETSPAQEPLPDAEIRP